VSYLQTSTANPYGHRPWSTRLYTSFDDFAYLKQPQNRILREPAEMQPRIYKPPEMAGLGDCPTTVLVTGAGRVCGVRRRPGRGRGLGALTAAPARTQIFYGPPSVRPISRGPIIYDGGPIFSYPIPGAPPAYPFPGPMPVAPPVILPPPIVPPPPTPVASGPDGTVWALPGTPATPGSPYMPAPPGQLPAPGTPITPDMTAAVPGPTFTDWFQSSTWIPGLRNGYVAIGAIAAFYFMGQKRGR
jgi:hypothetical protein